MNEIKIEVLEEKVSEWKNQTAGVFGVQTDAIKLVGVSLHFCELESEASTTFRMFVSGIDPDEYKD